MVRQNAKPSKPIFRSASMPRAHHDRHQRGDRAETIRILADPTACPTIWCSRVMCFRCARGGRGIAAAGHTEAAVDLVMLAAAGPSG